MGPPEHLDSTDIAYLKAKRALEIPDQEFQKALLQSYLKYIHDFLPIINVHGFLGGLLSGSQQPEDTRLSLFLYQAVMFASVGSVPFICLVNAGFKSRTEARALFACKVKVS